LFVVVPAYQVSSRLGKPTGFQGVGMGFHVALPAESTDSQHFTILVVDWITMHGRTAVTWTSITKDGDERKLRGANVTKIATRHPHVKRIFDW